MYVSSLGREVWPKLEQCKNSGSYKHYVDQIWIKFFEELPKNKKKNNQYKLKIPYEKEILISLANSHKHEKHLQLKVYFSFTALIT